MKISIATTYTNPDERQDPWKEAMACYEDFADEVIVTGENWPYDFSWDYIGKTFNEGFTLKDIPENRKAFKPFVVLPIFSHDQKLKGFRYFIFIDSLKPDEIIASPTVKSNFGTPLSIPMMKPAVVVCPKSVLFPNRKTLSLPMDCRIIGFVLPILILA